MDREPNRRNSMEYKFDLWYQPNKGSIIFLETIKITAASLKDAVAIAADMINKNTQIEYVSKPVTVAEVKKDLL